MKKRCLLFATLLLSITSSAVVLSRPQSGWPSHVKVFASERGRVTRVTGKLEDGQLMTDLSWAWDSANACFPETQSAKFRGNHVLFATVIPERSIMTITVKPDNDGANLSLYAYELGATTYSVVPDLPRCVTCEADHKWDYPKRGRVQTSARSVSVNAIGNPFNVVIGVAGASGLVSGGFTLEVELK